MKNDLSQGSVAVYTQRRRNKSIWLRCCMIVALVVVVLTSYVLIFPAHTADRELICAQKEHVHDESCYDEAGELVCGMEYHVHTDACYQETPVKAGDVIVPDILGLGVNIVASRDM